VRKLPTGDIEIVVPESVRLEDWLITLQAELEKLGYEMEQE
jgi:hypothetical protein